MKKAKNIAALLVNGGEKVAFIDEDDLIDFPKGYINNIEDAKGVVVVTNKLHINESYFKDENFFKEDKQIILQGANQNKQIISQNENKDIKIISKNKYKERKFKIINSILKINKKKYSFRYWL